MPLKDPEARRAYNKAYAAANREKANVRNREYRSRNPESSRSSGRRASAKYRENNRDLVNERQRLYHAARYAADPGPQIEASRQYRKDNREQVRERDNTRYRSGGKREKMRVWRLNFKHGMSPDDYQKLWDAQCGACYLCGDCLVQGKTAIDHDHSCCPAEASCAKCRRGLACSNCNSAIGMAQDDPARLRRIADALEAAQVLVERRKTQIPSEVA